MSKLILRFLTEESGTTAIEYALMAGSIAVVIIGTVNTVGSQINATFYTKISASFNDPDMRPAPTNGALAAVRFGQKRKLPLEREFGPRALKATFGPQDLESNVAS